MQLYWQGAKEIHQVYNVGQQGRLNLSGTSTERRPTPSVVLSAHTTYTGASTVASANIEALQNFKSQAINAC
mgnify:CR=1 FL=1